jgi:hypothetical protein
VLSGVRCASFGAPRALVRMIEREKTWGSVASACRVWHIRRDRTEEGAARRYFSARLKSGPDTNRWSRGHSVFGDK